MSNAGEYVLGTDRVELERLGLQSKLWSAVAHDAWHRAQLRAGQRALDVACGPGFASIELGHIVGREGAVLGVDQSEAFLQHARRLAEAHHLDWVEFREVDLAAPEPDAFGGGSFDLAYLRWILCFLPSPARTLGAVARALAPGGALVIHDYFNWRGMRINVDTPSYIEVMRASGEAWRARGGDPDVVGPLQGVCRSFGLEVEHLGVHQRLARPGTTMWAWPDSYWRSFVPRLVAGGFLAQSDADAFFEDWDRLSGDPDVFIQLPPVYELRARMPRS